MKTTLPNMFQEPDGSWWYRQPGGYRQRAYIYKCTTCEDEYVALKNRNVTTCSKKCYRKVCRTCGKEFKPTAQRQVYCAAACKEKKAICEECDNEFVVTRGSNGRFCSTECFYEHQVPTGTRRIDPDNGYVLIKVPKGTPGSKRATGGHHSRWMFEHRYVMQQHLGRPLLAKERVHHRFGDRTDNNINSLELTYCSGIGKEKHVPGQRIEDLIDYVLAYHREALLDKLNS